MSVTLLTFCVVIVALLDTLHETFVKSNLRQHVRRDKFGRDEMRLHDVLVTLISITMVYSC